MSSGPWGDARFQAQFAASNISDEARKQMLEAQRNDIRNLSHGMMNAYGTSAFNPKTRIMPRNYERVCAYCGCATVERKCDNCGAPA